MAEFVPSGFGARAGAWKPLSVPADTGPVTPTPPQPVRPPEPRAAAVPGEAARTARLETDLAAAHAETASLRIELAAARALVAVAPVPEPPDDDERSRLREALSDLVATRHRLTQEVREGVGELVLAAARRIAGEALRTQPGLLEALVADAAATLGSEGLRIRVAPGDVDRITRALEVSGVPVVADAAIHGGCVATSARGALDASLDTATTALRSVVEQWQSAGWRDESGG